MSVHALANAEEAAEKEKGTRQFRLASGYRAMVDWFAEQLRARDVGRNLGTQVKLIRWRPGTVEVEAQVGDVTHRLEWETYWRNSLNPSRARSSSLVRRLILMATKGQCMAP